MGSNQITWRNVDAPDMRDTILAQRSAADLFGRAVSGISDGLSGIKTRQDDTASAAATAEALRITDSAGWDKMMASGGLRSLGIAPNNMNDDFLKFAQGQRGELLENQRTAANTGLINNQTAVAGANFDRLTQENTEGKYRFGREQTGDIREDADLAKQDAQAALDSDSLNKAHEMAQTHLTMESAEREVLNNTSLSATQSNSLLAAIRATDASVWAPSEDALAAASLDTGAVRLSDSITGYNNLYGLEVGANDNHGIYLNAIQRSGNESGTAKGLVSRLIGLNSIQNTDGEETQADSAGDIVSSLNTLKEEYGAIPEAIIAAVMEDSLKESGWYWGDQIKTDIGGARKKLDALNDPKKLGALEKGRAKIEQTNKDLGEFSRRRDKAVSRLAMAQTRTGPIAEKAAQEARKSLEKIEADFVAWQGKNPLEGGQGDDDQADGDGTNGTNLNAGEVNDAAAAVSSLSKNAEKLKIFAETGIDPQQTKNTQDVRDQRQKLIAAVKTEAKERIDTTDDDRARRGAFFTGFKDDLNNLNQPPDTGSRQLIEDVRKAKIALPDPKTLSAIQLKSHLNKINLALAKVHRDGDKGTESLLLSRKALVEAAMSK